MPWNNNKMMSRDKKALRSFFTENLTMIDRRLSTTEIADKMGDSGRRAIRRLKKLKRFGFLDVISIKIGPKRTDHKWYITEEGLFYILTTFKRGKLKEFVKTNSDLRILSHISWLVSEGNWDEVDYLLNEIKNCTKDYQYRKISRLIVDWFKEGKILHRLKWSPKSSKN
ncbi:MAG: hypothetical protein ACRD92_02550 [Nitrosopumilaceae archaeon]